MPMIYLFDCTSCGRTIEFELTLRDAHPTKCPRCMGPLVRKYTPPNIIYRAGGFYSVDKRLDNNPDNTDETDS